MAEENYRCKVTFKRASGEEVVKITRAYSAPSTAKGQGTYLIRTWERGKTLMWVKTELQEADWTTVEVKQV